MMRRPPTMERKSGFTLIEVLLAVSVFAIVLGAINSVFFAALRLRNRTIEAFETVLPLQQALTLIQRDLEGIMPPGGALAGRFTTMLDGMSNVTMFAGERVTPDIYTSSGVVNEFAQWADVQKVTYYLAAPTNNDGIANSRDLVRQVTRNLLPVNIEEPQLQWLMSGVQTMRLQYYDGLSWTDAWDSNTNTNLPNAIKVQLTMAEDYVRTTKTPEPIELVVPVMVRSTTNSTEAAGGDQ
jgi:general secretion pathway protein J